MLSVNVETDCSSADLYFFLFLARAPFIPATIPRTYTMEQQGPSPFQQSRGLLSIDFKFRLGTGTGKHYPFPTCVSTAPRTFCCYVPPLECFLIHSTTKCKDLGHGHTLSDKSLTAFSGQIYGFNRAAVQQVDLDDWPSEMGAGDVSAFSQPYFFCDTNEVRCDTAALKPRPPKPKDHTSVGTKRRQRTLARRSSRTTLEADEHDD